MKLKLILRFLYFSYHTIRNSHKFLNFILFFLLLWLIIRKWKQQATKRRETREQKVMLANSAFNSLFLGPPLQQSKTVSNSDLISEFGKLFDD